MSCYKLKDVLLQESILEERLYTQELILECSPYISDRLSAIDNIKRIEDILDEIDEVISTYYIVRDEFGVEYLVETD